MNCFAFLFRVLFVTGPVLIWWTRVKKEAKATILPTGSTQSLFLSAYWYFFGLYLSLLLSLFHYLFSWYLLTWQGFKLTKQSMWRSRPSWQAVSANRHPSAGHFMSNQQSLGIQLAQLSRDASAAVSKINHEHSQIPFPYLIWYDCSGFLFHLNLFFSDAFQGAARRLITQRKTVEIESIGVAGKTDSKRPVNKYFRLEVRELVHPNGARKLIKRWWFGINCS